VNAIEHYRMQRLSNIPGPNSSLFRQRLARKPYCADDYAYGVRIRSQDAALTYRHIQPNTPCMVNHLVFDVDTPDAIERWFTVGLPIPSEIMRNPENGHCHYIYSLKTPVSKSAASRRKPIAYLAAIETAMADKLPADLGFGGGLCKTPNHPAWATWEAGGATATTYELWELAEHLDLSPASLSKINRQRKNIRVGLGRNIELFDKTRYWAYRWVQDFRAATKTQEQWRAAVLQQCESLNTFATPLLAAEVRAVARSIAKWTWTKYTGRLSDAEFSARQSARRKMAATKLKAKIKEVDNGD
jgi:Replicase family/Primase C terminal 1 (PriCT-1)